MQIDTAAQLIAQIDNGTNFKLIDNRLETQSNFAKFMQDLGDIFRSNQTISIRNERLALAIGYKLDPKNDRHQIQLFDINHAQGSRDLKKFKQDIIFSFLNKPLENICENHTQLERDNIVSFTKKTITDIINDIPINLTIIKQTINNILERNKEVFENIYLFNFEGIDENIIRSCEHTITAKLNEYFAEERTNPKLYIDDTGISNQSIIDATRNRPTITFNNQHLQIGEYIDRDDPQKKQKDENQLKNFLTRLTKNIEEQKFISFLLSQQALAPSAYIASSSPGYPILGKGHRANDIQDIIFRNADNDANNIDIKVDMTQENITVHYDLPFVTSLPDFNIKHKVGSIEYTVTMPRSAFYEHALVPPMPNMSQQDLEDIHKQDIQKQGQIDGIFNKPHVQLTVHDMKIKPAQPFVLNFSEVVQQQPVQEQPIQEQNVQQQPIQEQNVQ